jgi:hypothetical protein
MNENPYLSKYPQDETLSLYKTGSISPKIDSSYNLTIENSGSMFSTSITIPLKNTPTNIVKIFTKYNIEFTEL